MEIIRMIHIMHDYMYINDIISNMDILDSMESMDIMDSMKSIET